MSKASDLVLIKIKNLRVDLDRIGKQTARVRDQLRALVADADEELETIDEAKDGLDRVIDKLSEQH